MSGPLSCGIVLVRSYPSPPHFYYVKEVLALLKSTPNSYDRNTDEIKKAIIEANNAIASVRYAVAPGQKEIKLENI